ncbi:hypothetical protein CC99x_008760 [Candidatus Berkiella cookevillensis]|uniref:Phospho-2-dehydro-3-deoxyheptonate aldolase n=1 Tax=Candidatus Berkiella cookevillensis TaxID=437022 RepID=A0A0Q9YS94_9GAMM|nr:3-deoxy-7-phosphoheptulonate synthase [Candidatus Berkiella cookevillensis]MCS5708991.1 hypothetical protein [Candidatus Berkiella cookevillensis]
MIIILKPNTDPHSAEYQFTLNALSKFANVEAKISIIQGVQESITEIHLIGDTQQISKESIEALPAVHQVIRISSDYKILGRYSNSSALSFEYNGVHFSQDSFHVFAGLCAVDNAENVESTFKVLSEYKQVCTRMGAYKPRTSPYAFQGLGKSCLPYVFELAGQYGIKVIAMEVTHERQIEEINDVLALTGNPTGVMLQIGTRNAQNFELLRAVGSQQTFPILFKRGFGITLNESLLAAEYLAKAGNNKIIFCLRGVKSHFGNPHRNLVDFCQVSLVKRITRLAVCVDPSHAVGLLSEGTDKISDIYHVSAQGVIAGANMVLLDVHPNPPQARVDSQQALHIQNLEWFLQDMLLCRETYEKRKKLAETFHA